MRPLPLSVLLSVPALILSAQAPDANLGQKLRTERPEVERMINELQSKEALARAEALLPPAKPAFDKASPQTMYMSYATFLSLSQAYHLAFKAANAAGQWEKAHDYIKKAREISLDNYANTQEPFKLIAKNSRTMAERTRASLKENEAYINHLKALKEKDASDMQQLELVEQEKKNIEDLEKRAIAFEEFIKTAKADSERYEPFVAYIEKQIKDQETQIAEYKHGKGDKGKWVEAVIANPSTYASITEKRDLLGFLYRLNVLDPENKKVLHQIDVVLGKAAAAPAKKATKGKAK